MIKAYLADGNKLFTITQYDLFPTIDSTTWDSFFAFIGTYWKTRTQPANVTIRFSEQYPDNFDKINALLEKYKISNAIEKLP